MAISGGKRVSRSKRSRHLGGARRSRPRGYRHGGVPATQYKRIPKLVKRQTRFTPFLSKGYCQKVVDGPSAEHEKNPLKAWRHSVLKRSCYEKYPHFNKSVYNPAPKISDTITYETTTGGRRSRKAHHARR